MTRHKQTAEGALNSLVKVWARTSADAKTGLVEFSGKVMKALSFASPHTFD